MVQIMTAGGFFTCGSGQFTVKGGLLKDAKGRVLVAHVLGVRHNDGSMEVFVPDIEYVITDGIVMGGCS